MIAQQTILTANERPWGWPVIGNFLVVGAAAGYYELNFLADVLANGAAALSNPVTYGLPSVIIVCIGFLLTSFEAGRPTRGYQMFRHLSESWMSREVLGLAVFVTAAIIDVYHPHPMLRLLALAAALVLMTSQGLIVYKVRHMTAWKVPLIPVLFLSSGFASGYGMMLLMGLPAGASINEVYFVGAFLVIINMIVWLLYLKWSTSDSFLAATKLLRHPIVTAFIVGFGHVLPLLLIGFFWIISKSQGFIILPYIISLLTGLFLIMGIAAQKAGIILSVGYVREIASKT